MEKENIIITKSENNILDRIEDMDKDELLNLIISIDENDFSPEDQKRIDDALSKTGLLIR